LGVKKFSFPPEAPQLPGGLRWIGKGMVFTVAPLSKDKAVSELRLFHSLRNYYVSVSKKDIRFTLTPLEIIIPLRMELPMKNPMPPGINLGNQYDHD
jgi:hypothetical protein